MAIVYGKLTSRVTKGAVLCIAALAAPHAYAKPTDIYSCITITQPGSYILGEDVVYGGPENGTCITIMVSKVIINLDGHTMSNGNPRGIGNFTTAIAAADDTEHVTVKDGYIFGFGSGVELLGTGSTVKDIHVGGPCPCNGVGIGAIGAVKDNAVTVQSAPDGGIGMHVGGVVEGNYVYDTRSQGMVINANSTVRGNTVTGTFGYPGVGMRVNCPSTVAHNTITDSWSKNLVLNGEGCMVRDNTAP